VHDSNFAKPVSDPFDAPADLAAITPSKRPAAP
jgi:hypothetical protein